MFNSINRRQRKAPAKAQASQPSESSPFSFSFDIQPAEAAHQSVNDALAAASMTEGTFNVNPNSIRIRTKETAVVKSNSVEATEVVSEEFNVTPIDQLPLSSLVVTPNQESGNFMKFAGPGTHSSLITSIPPPKPKGKMVKGKKFTKPKVTPVPTSICGVPSSQVQKNSSVDWLLDVGPLKLEECGVDSIDELTDISMDPESHMLTVYNTSDKFKSVYVSLIEPYRCFDRDYRALQSACAVFPINPHKTMPSSNGKPVDGEKSILIPSPYVSDCNVNLLKQEEYFSQIENNMDTIAEDEDEDEVNGADTLDDNVDFSHIECDGKTKCSAKFVVSGGVTTFALVVPPMSSIDVCYVYPLYDTMEPPVSAACTVLGIDPSLVNQDDLDLEHLQQYLYSNVTEMSSPPLTFPLPLDPATTPTKATPSLADLVVAEAGDIWTNLVPVVRFPLLGGPYLVTQGCSGALTHYTAQTRHAIDISCPRGTPVVAVADAEVVSISEGSHCQGAHTANLFNWNSIMLRVKSSDLVFIGDSPVPNKSIFIEYVHVSPHSISVTVGSTVRAGDIIAYTGAAGFCPQPHLHIQVQASMRNDAPTIPFAFATTSNVYDTTSTASKQGIIPCAGTFLSEDKIVEKSVAADWIDLANVISDTIGNNQVDEDEYGIDKLYSETHKFPYWIASQIVEYSGNVKINSSKK